jgi:hypothetical protein
MFDSEFNYRASRQVETFPVEESAGSFTRVSPPLATRELSPPWSTGADPCKQRHAEPHKYNKRQRHIFIKFWRVRTWDGRCNVRAWLR